jgi:hypothetical protein
MAVTAIEETTKQAPVFSDGVSNVRDWIAGMSSAIEHLRELSTAIRQRWGFTRYADLPFYPGNVGGREGEPMPDYPLVLEKSEIEVLLWARTFLDEAIEWASHSKPSSSGQSPPLRVVGAEVRSVNEDRDEYIAKRFADDNMPWKTILGEVAQHPEWSCPEDESGLRKAYTAYCARKGIVPVTRKKPSQ